MAVDGPSLSVLWVACHSFRPADERDPAKIAARVLAICQVESSRTSFGAWSSRKATAQAAASSSWRRAPVPIT